MGENRQKGYKQTDLGVLAEGEVCVTVGMGCGKKAVPETGSPRRPLVQLGIKIPGTLHLLP